MSRPLRIEYPGALYHVVSHGNGRLWLFEDTGDYSMLLEILAEYLNKYRVLIHNFVIMRNHFHLVAETELPNLGLFMNQRLRGYAMYLISVHTPRKQVEIGDLFKMKKFAVAQRLHRFKQGQLREKKIQKVVRSLARNLLGRRYV